MLESLSGLDSRVKQVNRYIFRLIILYDLGNYNIS